MNTEQAMNIMEQAVLLATKSAQSINDQKLIISAWETIKDELSKPQDACPIRGTDELQ